MPPAIEFVAFGDIALLRSARRGFQPSVDDDCVALATPEHLQPSLTRRGTSSTTLPGVETPG
jgi:hypothetical protein